MQGFDFFLIENQCNKKNDEKNSIKLLRVMKKAVLLQSQIRSVL